MHAAYEAPHKRAARAHARRELQRAHRARIAARRTRVESAAVSAQICQICSRVLTARARASIATATCGASAMDYSLLRGKECAHGDNAAVLSARRWSAQR